MNKKKIKEGNNKKKDVMKDIANDPVPTINEELSAFKKEIIKRIGKLEKFILSTQPKNAKSEKSTVKKPVSPPATHDKSDIEELEQIKQILHKQWNLDIEKNDK